MRDIKYIIKRILIGVGVVLTLSFLKGNLFLGVNAEELITRQPFSIGILADNSYNEYSIISNTGWDSHDVWSPNTPSNDWGGTARLNYNYTGGDYCTQTQNYGTLSGIFYNASTSLNAGVVVKFLYTDISSEFTCSTDITGNKGTFSCTGIDFTKTFSLLIYNANPGAYGVVKQLGYTCEASIGSQIANDNQNTQNIINNNNQNTQNIINNNNQNTQNIINNQNQNTQQQIESQKACIDYDISSASFKNKYILNTDGSLVDTTNSSVTDFISLTSNDTLTLIQPPNQYANVLAFYNVNKSFISSYRTLGMTAGQNISIPQNTAYVRFTINNLQNLPQFKICRNGNQAIVDSQNQLNNTLNDDNIDGANSEASSFFDDFQSDSHGLSGVITSPLRLINSLTTASCSPLQFQLPFVHNQVSLPCMRSIYENHFGVFFSLYQLITTGLISYLVMINLYSKIHNLQNPHNDRIEVLNL